MVMSPRRFRLLLRASRFDDLETRTQKKNIDKLAPISNIFEMFVKNCQDCYCVEEYLTLDEKLEKFRVRCFFKQYITSKPRKYDNIFVYPMLNVLHDKLRNLCWKKISNSPTCF